MRITVSLLLVAAGLFAADPRIGTWERISAEETIDPPRTMTISSGANGIHPVFPFWLMDWVLRISQTPKS